MPIETVNVTGTFNLPDDSWTLYSKAEFVLSGVDTDGEVVLDFDRRSVILTSTGGLDIDLWPNERGQRGTIYQVYIVRYATDEYAKETGRVHVGAIQISGDNASEDITDLLSQVVTVPGAWYSTITEDEYNAAIDAAADAQESAAQAALYDGPWFDTEAALRADTLLTYTSGTPSSVTVGQYVRERRTGQSFRVVASGATDFDLSTAGGVRLVSTALRQSVIITADLQPVTEGQVTEVRTHLSDIAAFCRAYERPVRNVRVLGDIVDRPVANDGSAPLYSYPNFITDYYSRNLPQLVTLPGNHDMALGESSHPTNYTTVDYRRTFGVEFYARRFGNMLEIYLGDMAGGSSGEQSQAALEWFESLLRDSTDCNIEIHLHQPIYGAYGSSVAAYNTSGWPSDPLTISTAYQFYSQRIGTAIEACPNVCAVFYGHVGTSYAASTQVVTQFGTQHIGFQVGFSTIGSWPRHYGVVDYTHGSTAVRLRRRDSVTGDWIAGSEVNLTYAYPVNLHGPVFEGQQHVERINGHIHGALTITADVGDEREEVSPGVWDSRDGVRYMIKTRLTEMSRDDVLVGTGSGILLGIPGANNEYTTGGTTAGFLIASRPGGAWGASIEATKAQSADVNFVGKLSFKVQNGTAGQVATLAEVFSADGNDGTAFFPLGIKPRVLGASDSVNGLRLAPTGYNAERSSLEFVAWGDFDVSPADIPARFSQGFTINREDDSASQFFLESGGGAARAWMRGYTGGITGTPQWGGWRIIKGLGPDSFLTVTTATATVQGWHDIVTCNRAGTVTLTLPSAASFTGRELYISTQTANAVNSASSNVLGPLGGSAGTGILPAVLGAWAYLVSDGTNWRVMDSSFRAAVVDPRTRPGVPTVVAAGTSTAVTGADAVASPQTAATFTVPAGYMGRFGKAEIRMLTAQTNNANNKTVRVNFGAARPMESAGGFTGSSATDRTVTVFNVNSEAVQAFLPADAIFSPSETGGAGASSATVDTAADVTCTITVQLANAADSLQVVRWELVVTHVA